MTRETKIGLLVGLAFIIVIGILLSDHFRSTMEPPQASLASAASAVRDAVSSPGTSNPPVVVVAPKDAPPSQQVPTRDELNPLPSPVIPTPRQTVAAPTPTDNRSANNGNDQIAGADPQNNTQNNTVPSPESEIQNTARQHGEELVQVNSDGTTTALTPASSPKSYKAQPGDSVSRMAARLLGGNTRTNRQAIIEANPSLQDDPDRVIVGEAYVIPVKSVATASPTPQQTVDQSTQAVTPAQPAVVTAQYFYIVQEDDSLWRIANDELGDPGTVDAIKELNLGILKGKNHDVVTPGMRLRLPTKPIASAS